MFFMPKSENETPRSSKDLREIPNKFTYFKDKRSYDKLQTIILNFTNNLKVTKEQIEHIFELRDKSILMKCFKGLKKVTNTHEK